MKITVFQDFEGGVGGYDWSTEPDTEVITEIYFETIDSNIAMYKIPSKELFLVELCGGNGPNYNELKIIDNEKDAFVSFREFGDIIKDYLSEDYSAEIDKAIMKRGSFTLNRKNIVKKRKIQSTIENLKFVDAFAYMLDITEKNSFDAKEQPRALKFGDYQIKMAILLTGGTVIINLIKTRSNQERKEFWEKLLLNAETYRLENIAVDTDCEHEDPHLNLFPVERDNDHYSNQNARRKIGSFMSAIYRNIGVIKSLDIDNALRYIKDLAKQQFEDCRITIIAE
jgi:hypothetical protein